MATHMERVLVALSLVLVLEAVSAKAALVLLLSFVGASFFVSNHVPHTIV
jgi:hypothetical protein